MIASTQTQQSNGRAALPRAQATAQEPIAYAVRLATASEPIVAVLLLLPDGRWRALPYRAGGPIADGVSRMLAALDASDDPLSDPSVGRLPLFIEAADRPWRDLLAGVVPLTGPAAH